MSGIIAGFLGGAAQEGANYLSREHVAGLQRESEEMRQNFLRGQQERALGHASSEADITRKHTSKEADITRRHASKEAGLSRDLDRERLDAQKAHWAAQYGLQSLSAARQNKLFELQTKVADLELGQKQQIKGITDEIVKAIDAGDTNAMSVAVKKLNAVSGKGQSIPAGLKEVMGAATATLNDILASPEERTEARAIVDTLNAMFFANVSGGEKKAESSGKKDASKTETRGGGPSPGVPDAAPEKPLRRQRYGALTPWDLVIKGMRSGDEEAWSYARKRVEEGPGIIGYAQVPKEIIDMLNDYDSE